MTMCAYWIAVGVWLFTTRDEAFWRILGALISGVALGVGMFKERTLLNKIEKLERVG